MSKFVEMTSKDDVFTKYTGFCSYTIEGKGKMWYKDESVYEGEFKNGCKNGNGVLTFKNGKKCDGLFCDDKFIAGTIIGKDADRGDYEYKGYVQNYVPHGWGINKWMVKGGNCVTWEGKFENNKFVSGTCDDGKKKIVGDCKNGALQGNGYIENKDGRKWTGTWKDGFLHDGTYNGLECEDEKRKWGFLDCKVHVEIIRFKSENFRVQESKKYYKIKIVSGKLKGKSCLMKVEWMNALSEKEKNVDGYWKMNTIFHREDEFEEVLSRLCGKKITYLNVEAQKIESAMSEDSKKRKRDGDDMDNVWKFVSELAQQKSDK